MFVAGMDDNASLASSDSQSAEHNTIENLVSSGSLAQNATADVAKESQNVVVKHEELRPLITEIKKPEITKKAPRRSIIVSTSISSIDLSEGNTYMGNLLIRCGLFKLMSRKYFVLKNNVFEYFESRDAYASRWGMESKAFGLTSKSSIRFCDAKFTFELKEGDLKWVIQAQNTAEMNAWTSRLLNTIKFLRANGDNIIGVNAAGKQYVIQK